MKVYTVSYSRYRIGDFEWNTTDKVIATFSTKAQATKFMSICKKTTKNHKTYNFSYYIDLFRLNETDDLKTLLQWKVDFMNKVYIVGYTYYPSDSSSDGSEFFILGAFSTLEFAHEYIDSKLESSDLEYFISPVKLDDFNN